MSWFRILICLVSSLALSLILHAETDEELFQKAQADALDYLRTCAEGNIQGNPTLSMTFIRDGNLAQGILNTAATQLEELTYHYITEQTHHLPEDASLLERLRSLQEEEQDPAQSILWLALLNFIDIDPETDHTITIAHALFRAMEPNLQQLPPPDNFNPPEIHLGQFGEDDSLARRIPQRLLLTYTVLRSM